MNRQIFKNPETTIIVRMDGDYFKSQGNFHNDLVVADCAIEPQNGRLVVAIVRGQQLVRRLSQRGKSQIRVTDDGPGALAEVRGRSKGQNNSGGDPYNSRPPGIRKALTRHTAPPVIRWYIAATASET